MNTQKLDTLAALVKREQQEIINLKYENLGPDYVDVRLVPGAKYTKLDIKRGGQWSGSLMIDADGNIYGIKAYGVVHKSHRYGTLDTIADWYWGDYYPWRRAAEAAPAIISVPEKSFFVGESQKTQPLTAGNILVGSWGYDQTNIDFYQIVACTGKTVTFCEMNQNETETGFMCGNCTPIPGSYKSPTRYTRRVDVDENGKATVKFSKDGTGRGITLTLWDGNPRHWSSYA